MAEVTPTIGDGAWQLTMWDAIEIALQRNYGLVIERYNLEESGFRLTENKGIYDLGFKTDFTGFDGLIEDDHWFEVDDKFATQVDGVYTADPKVDPEATRYDELTFHDVLARDLRVMDASAVSLARDNAIPIIVFSIHDKGRFVDVLQGGGPCTVVS